MVVFDDGSGPALYVGGSFAAAGGVVVNHIARWDGQAWSALGSGVGGEYEEVFALTVFDDGTGPALYAGGDFTTAGGVPAKNIARWDGKSWSALGTGVGDESYESVSALVVFDDGGGPALYAGGSFTAAGGILANHIARWDGQSWSVLDGLDGYVEALAVFDDGYGEALYVGGNFESAGGVSANHIARWDGQAWTALDGGVDGYDVTCITTFDDGGGPALYAGGNFSAAGGVPANRIARWDGRTWSSLGSGLIGVEHPVRVLEVFDDGLGPALYAGGRFTTAGGIPTKGMARWDGQSWSAVGDGVDGTVQVLSGFDDGSGPALYAGGIFTRAGGVVANNIARWDGQSWSMGGIAGGNGLDDWVTTLAAFDDGQGPALYAGGEFTAAGDVASNLVARWDGQSWSALGTGIDGSVYALAGFDDGSGPALYVGGYLYSAGGVPVNHIARWDGQSWSALGSGVNGSGVRCLVVFDDGGGPALYAGGGFSLAGGVGVGNIARWDGQSWSSIGGVNSLVLALAVFDDGRGPALYAGGWFGWAGTPAYRIARWDGQSWSALGSGLNSHVTSLAVYDDGGGSALYVGGHFTMAGGMAANHIARWDGQSWSVLDGGVDGYAVQALAAFDDGHGEALYAGGDFETAGGVSANRIAHWDGQAWSALGSGMNSHVRALATFDDGGGTSLYAGGYFTTAGGVASSHIASLRCGLVCNGDLNGDTFVNMPDLAVLLEVWGPCDVRCVAGQPDGSCPADINADCTVNAYDLAPLLGNWGSCP